MLSLVPDVEENARGTPPSSMHHTTTQISHPEKVSVCIFESRQCCVNTALNEGPKLQGTS